MSATLVPRGSPLRLAACVLSALAAIAAPGCLLCAEDWDVWSDTWVATDALGRKLPGFEECGPPRADRTVGIFYFLWVNNSITNGGGSLPVDIGKIVKENPEKPAWGPVNAFHFWGEPELGYYTVDDEYVLRKHLQYLLEAQVDVLIFDVTNAITYHPQYMKLCEVYDAARKTGIRTPQVSFILNSNPADTIKRLHDEFYAKDLYPELWFRWLGKPLLLAPPSALTDAHREFFTVRQSWAWSDPKGWFKDGKDKWTWVDHCPQKPGWHEAPDKPEEISVAVAQHPVSNIGRSFRNRKQPPPADVRTGEGLCFAEQWRRALQVDPQFVFITGWNEWIAQRFVATEKNHPGMLGRPTKPGDTFFVDQYNDEFSRDIEPMKDGFTDNYFFQMVGNIRLYKGVRPPPLPKPAKIVVDGRFGDWDTVAPEFRDHIGDTFRRDSLGWSKKMRYENKTGRNDFVRLKVSYDDAHVFFYAETAQPITRFSDPRWMLLFVDADQDTSTGWQGYDYVVNLAVKSDRVTTLKKNLGGWKWSEGEEIPYRAEGHRMELAIPRKCLGLENKPVRLDFHWADNIQKEDDIAEFSVSGDSAPARRFNYRYDAALTPEQIAAWAKAAGERRRAAEPKR